MGCCKQAFSVMELIWYAHEEEDYVKIMVLKEPHCFDPQPQVRQNIHGVGKSPCSYRTWQPKLCFLVFPAGPTADSSSTPWSTFLRQSLAIYFGKDPNPIVLWQGSGNSIFVLDPKVNTMINCHYSLWINYFYLPASAIINRYKSL